MYGPRILRISAADDCIDGNSRSVHREIYRGALVQRREIRNLAGDSSSRRRLGVGSYALSSEREFEDDGGAAY